MIVYRICQAAYKDDISGNGAKLYGSRWNSRGIPLLYASEHISLAALEMLIHIQLPEIPASYHLLSIFIPDNTFFGELKLSKLKSTWKNDLDYSSFIGDEFIKSKENLFLKVPSAVVQEEYNFLINPLHAEFKKVHVSNAKEFEFDKRLFHI